MTVKVITKNETDLFEAEHVNVRRHEFKDDHHATNCNKFQNLLDQWQSYSIIQGDHYDGDPPEVCMVLTLQKEVGYSEWHRLICSDCKIFIMNDKGDTVDRYFLAKW